MGAADKRDVSLAYLDYMRETAGNVTQVKAVQAKLRGAGLLEVPMNEGAAAETQELNLPDGSILGKRQRTQ